MATQLNIAEAKAKFSELVERAASGETIVIARAGVPVAKLIAYEGKPSRANFFGVLAHLGPVPDEALTPEPEDWMGDWAGTPDDPVLWPNAAEPSQAPFISPDDDDTRS